MKKLIRHLYRMAAASPNTSPKSLLLHRRKNRSQSADVPEGHFPVFVGEEMERYVVHAEVLRFPAFLELLRMSAEEYGYEQRGVLRIPCSVELFERVVGVVCDGDGCGGEIGMGFTEEVGLCY